MKFLTMVAIGAMSLMAGDALLAKDADQAANAPKKNKTTTQLTDAHNGKTVAVGVGQSFDVVLRGNPTTGYEWRVDKIASRAVEQNGKADYTMDKRRRRMMGVGGTYTFHFDVKQAAKTKVRFVYARSWEKNTEPAKTFEAVIDSESKATPANTK
jgi:predicted secreted protein